MSRPPFEVADIIRISGDSFRQRYSASLTWPQRKVLDAIVRCRTAALGGHRDACVSCGHQAISYNSCRNRHCPKCQTGARDQWLAKRQQELLAVGYYHLVFSVPHMLVPLMWQNKRQLFSLLFEASAAALLDVAVDPKHLGAELGFLAILHTWGQTLTPHPHIHCVVPGGGLTPDLARYTHRVAISNHRLLSVSAAAGLLPLEGLCSPKQAAHDVTCFRRVPAPLRPACAATRFSPHPLLRLPRQPQTSPHAAALP